MECPKCGTQNADNYKFCQKCGTKLPIPISPPQPVAENRQVSRVIQSPPNPVNQAAWIGLGGSALSGALIILGWFTPWFGLSGIASQLTGRLGYSSMGGLLGLGSGVGNGLQMTLFGLTASYAAFRLNSPLLGLLALVVAALMIAIVIIGITFIRLALSLFELRPENQADGINKVFSIRSRLQALRGRSGFLFVLLVIIFVIAAAIPFGTSILGRGFFLSIFGAICGYVSAIIAQNSVKNY